MKHASFLAATAVIALLGFAAPANATHVTCGQTIMQNTTLDSDVQCPSGTQTGLTIGADNVTLNLGGFTLRGGGEQGVGGGTREAPLSGVQVRNGTIEGVEGLGFWFQGVALFANDSSVRGLTVAARDAAINFQGDRNSALLNDLTVFGGGVL